MSLAENIKKLRERKELSQGELARLVDVSQPTIAQYEKGMKLPSIVVGVELAKRLGTTCEELVK